MRSTLPHTPPGDGALAARRGQDRRPPQLILLDAPAPWVCPPLSTWPRLFSVPAGVMRRVFLFPPAAAGYSLSLAARIPPPPSSPAPPPIYLPRTRPPSDRSLPLALTKGQGLWCKRRSLERLRPAALSCPRGSGRGSGSRGR